MQFVETKYVLNYLPKAIKQSIADDDEIESWVMQAWRKLNFPNLRYVKDISFLEVKNHKTRLPADLKRIVSVAVNVTEPTLEELNELCGIDLPSNNSFASPCPISYKLFVNSNCYKNNWEPVSFVGNLKDDYLCRVDHTYPNHVYSMEQGSDILTFDFLEGTVAIEYWSNPTNSKGDILLPREPEELWEYLAAHVRMNFWQNETALGTANAFQLYQDAKLERSGYYEAAKRYIMVHNYNVLTAREQIYGPMRYVKLPGFITRLYASKHDHENGTILE